LKQGAHVIARRSHRVSISCPDAMPLNDPDFPPSAPTPVEALRHETSGELRSG
jgi:hypothetical protein